VAVASEYHPDAIVLDIGMPKMNGYEVAKKLRGEATGKEMTLIALSGWGQDADKQRSRESGIDHHLVKPLEPSALLRLLAANSRRGQVKLVAS